MIIWLDAQLTSRLAQWIHETFEVEAYALRELGLRDATDSAIFAAAGTAGTVILSKDVDFVDLFHKLGPLPQVIWPTCGNTSNQNPRTILQQVFPHALKLLREGEGLIETSGS